MASKKVLLVDDDRFIVHGAHLRLEAAGYDIVEAYDGDGGLANAIEVHPDAIVLDIQMPGKDGLQVLDELRHRDDTRDIPVIMLSASVLDRKQALDGGARFFLNKPYAGKSLVDAVGTAISEKAAAAAAC